MLKRNTLKWQVTDRLFYDQRFWSLERIKALINHILENHCGFVTNLRYHAMSIRS